MKKAVVIFFLLFSYLNVNGQKAIAKEWDLSIFYEEHDDWELDRDIVIGKIDSLSRLASVNIENRNQFLNFFQLGSALRERVSRLLIYSIFKIDSDTSSNEFQELYSVGTSLETQLEGQLSKIESSILSLPKDSITSWSASLTPPEKRRIFRILELRKHTLSPPEMEVIKEMQGFQYTTADSYWSLRNGIDFPYVSIEGDSIHCNPGAYYRICNLEDAARTEGLDKMFQSFSKFQDLMGLLYQRRVELDRKIGKKLGFNSGISARWKIRDHIPSGSVDELINALDSNSNTVQMYARAKAKILQKSTLDYQDLYKVIDIPGYDYTLENSMARILISAQANPRLKSTFENILDKPITNIAFRENKQYSYGIYPPITGEPYFLMNYLPNHKNARALSGALFLMAAWNGLPEKFLPDSRDDGPVYSNGVIYLGDLFFDDFLIENESGIENKKRLLINVLDFYWYYGVRWMIMAKMDALVEAKIAQGENLTGEEINTLYGSILKSIFNSTDKSVEIDNNAKSEWTVYPIPFGSYEHHYWPIGLSFASKVFLESKEDQNLLNNILFELPRSENLDRSYDLLKTVDIDISSEDFFQNTFRAMDFFLQQLEILN